jgi:SH3 domain-containing protein
MAMALEIGLDFLYCKSGRGVIYFLILSGGTHMSKHFFPLRLEIIFIMLFLLVSCAPAAPTEAAPPESAPTNVPSSIQNPTATPVPEIVVGVVEVDILNVREGPGTSYPILSSLAKGEMFYILGEVTNNTNNKWLLIDPSKGPFGWVIGDQSYVSIQQEIVDLATYLIWQKNVEDSKALLVISTASP